MARRRTLKVEQRRRLKVGDLVEVAGGQWVGVVYEVYMQEAEHDFWLGEFDWDEDKIAAYVQSRGGVRLVEMATIITSEAYEHRHFKTELCRIVDVK